MAVTGAFNYKLKDLARTLFEKGLIKSNWESDTKCGKSSILSIKRIAEDAKNNKISLDKHQEFDDLIKYNETDCMVTYEIIDYFRNRI